MACGSSARDRALPRANRRRIVSSIALPPRVESQASAARCATRIADMASARYQDISLVGTLANGRPAVARRPEYRPYHAAVHAHRSAGSGGGLCRGEVHGKAGDLLGGGEPANQRRRALRIDEVALDLGRSNAFFGRNPGDHVVELFGACQAGQNRVDGDAGAGKGLGLDVFDVKRLGASDLSETHDRATSAPECPCCAGTPG